jgi:hypothetical protein
MSTCDGLISVMGRGVEFVYQLGICCRSEENRITNILGTVHCTELES